MKQGNCFWIPGGSLGAGLEMTCWSYLAGLEYDLDLFNIVAVDDFNMVSALFQLNVVHLRMK